MTEQKRNALLERDEEICQIIVDQGETLSEADVDNLLREKAQIEMLLMASMSSIPPA